MEGHLNVVPHDLTIATLLLGFRLDEAFLFERSIEIETYDRHAEKLREELTLARMDRHSGQLDELDVEGILGFAERVLPRAADLSVQASLEQRQRFQQLNRRLAPGPP